MKPNIRSKINYRALVLSIGFTLVCIGYNLIAHDTLTMDVGIRRLGLPLLRLLFFISFGLFIGQVIESMGWTRQVAVLARPFFRFSHMGDRCSAAFTTAFFSGVSANALLLDFYQGKKITKMQLFLSNYINQFPAFFLHLPTTVFIVLPLTGYAGGLYFLITFLATLFRTICFLIFGRFVLPRPASKSEGPKESRSEGKKKKPALNETFANIKNRLPARISNIIVWVLPIYTIVFLLNINGVFNYLNQSLSHYVVISIMPVESLSVVILSFAAEFTSGFAAAGALMDAGVITIKQTVIALLIGNVLAFPVRALRHQLPRYMGIFSPKMGLQLLLSGQLFRVISIILMGTLYYMVA